MPVKAVRITPVSKAVPVPGSTTLSFSASRSGSEEAPVVVLYSVMDGAEVRITGGGQASPTIGTSSTTVAQRVDFDRTENPTPMAFRVRAVVTENGVEQFERIWPIRVDSTALAEAMLESGQSLEAEGSTGRKRATKTRRKSAAKKKASATKRAGGAKRSAAKKKSTAKKSTAKKSTARKSAAKKGAAKKGAAKRSTAKKSASRTVVDRARREGMKKSAARRGGALKRAAAKGAGAKRAGMKGTGTKRRGR